MTMALDYVVPADDLAPFVTLFYRFETDAPMFEDVERADHAQFRFRLTPGRADYRFPDGTEQDAPPIHFLGATSGAIRTRAEGPLLVFGMGLTPAGWAAILGIDAHATVNRALDAPALLGSVVRDAAALLSAAGTAHAMAGVAEPLIRSLIQRDDRSTLSFVREVDAWLAGCASPAIDELVALTGLSRRQVERRCRQLYGAPPKLLARKYRALRAAVLLAEGADDQPDGFYDQSHLIREVKQFTGLTPRQIRDRPGELAQLTIAQRRGLHGQVAPIISDT
ncbi:MAG TPA: helix-turn-helix domain-containing protein [Sphingomonas sp.]|jgi:AraC-like DNA-binding protein